MKEEGLGVAKPSRQSLRKGHRVAMPFVGESEDFRRPKGDGDTGEILETEEDEDCTGGTGERAAGWW